MVILILLAGIVATVWLVTQGPLKLFPKAGVSKPIPQETSLTLIGPNDCAQGFFCALLPQKDIQPGEEFEVKLFVRSDIDEANLFQARMSFPASLVEVSSIKTDDSFVKNWVENYYDNSAGQINLTGGVPAPGFQTKFGNESAYMATIIFKAKVAGTGIVSFNSDSAIYRNTDNVNILTIKRDYDISIGTTPSPTSSPSPTPTPPDYCEPPPPPPPPGCNYIFGDPNPQDPNRCPVYKLVCPNKKGDGNSDGKVNLVDMSVLLTDFNKEKGFREPIDMNDDKKINTFDFSLMRKLLLDLEVIKGGKG